ncbi:Dihydroorotate dehydrogenase (quinone) [hydrothermal vent metagenome]|uniref:dihydroorotate dehydrogenase (quinone) n=1 Tax=hydrothermal vent metagenome TaxID=652676 RepID=A0A3B0W9M7_9ZZZZ
MYSLIKRFLFLFNAETIHVFSLKALSFANNIGLLQLFLKKRINSPVTVMGIKFPNAVGLAAGLDKDAKHIDALAQCGFGFIEVGTVTPLAQSGNNKPRLFRLTADNAIINRMGFNNAGVEALINNVKKSHQSCVLGINIGKNKVTPLENAADDYLACMSQVYSYADYIAINISSPNTPGLRELQHGEGLSALLTKLKNKQAELNEQYQRYVPLAVKIAPDLDKDEIKDIAKRLLNAKIDAIIATNTTNSRPITLCCKQLATEAGGLSGKPIFDLSTKVLKQLVAALDGNIPVIAVGGISSAADALEKINAGASLVQIYTGFIFTGPDLVYGCAKTLKEIREK